MRIPPGATIGIIGGGQLGRMLAIAAARLGYRCHIYDPHEAPCAADVAARFTRGRFDDEAALADFARDCAVVTYEFENLAVAPLKVLGTHLRPGIKSLGTGQDRCDEKRFLESVGARPARWLQVDSAADAERAEAELGLPFVLKTRRLGYDGKGQAWVREAGGGAAAFAAIGGEPAVAEAGIAFDAEFSVIIARAADGETRAFPVPRNEHEGGILRRSTVPAGPAIAPHVVEAEEIAARIAAALGHIGVLAVEFFACAEGALVNEFAPRVHNSGHWTIEGACTSQFEQHIRAICGLPLGDAGLVAGGAMMENLIGPEANDWAAILAKPGANLHLYGKDDPRPGRKMGHVTYLT